MKSLVESLFDKNLVASDIRYDELLDKIIKGDFYAFDILFEVGDVYKMKDSKSFLKTKYIYHSAPKRKAPICIILLKGEGKRSIISFTASAKGCFKTTSFGNFWIDGGYDFAGKADSDVGKDYLYSKLNEKRYTEYSIVTNKMLATELFKKLDTNAFRL